MALRWPIFLWLVRSKIAIEPRWDALLPIDRGALKDLALDCARAIPESRRAAAMIEACRDEHVYAVQNALMLFEHFPTRELAGYLLELAKDAEPGWRKRLHAAVTAAAAKDDDVAALIASGKKRATRKTVLACAKVLKRPTLAKLTPAQQKQLRAAGKRYDGDDLPAADRLNPDPENEQSFLSSPTICALHDANGEPAYDAFLYMVDSGTIFKAGTTKVAAEIVQESMEYSNEALADALDDVLKKYRD